MIVNKYIGLPYKDNGRDEQGIDCWGLARLYYKQELKIDLPSFSENYNGETSENIKELVSQQKEHWTETKEPIPGDLVLFNIYGEPTHIGVYIGDSKFLHARDKKDSVIESLTSPQWNKRIVGFFKYSEKRQLIEVAGMPNPLKTLVYKDWTVPGTSLREFSTFVKDKYKVSDRLYSHITILVDGVPVPEKDWDTTVVKVGQTLAYRAVPGKEVGRLVLMIVVAYIAFEIAGPAAAEYAAFNLETGAAATKMIQFAAVAATQVAGAVLINAIMPIRPPSMNDPGQGSGLNLFTGTSNQANRFGAIPVVLGKVRMTGVLGATPYIESLTDTNIMNLLIVWGYGPLEINTNDIQVGTNKLSTYYEGFAQQMPVPVTLKGHPEENPAIFNKLYGRDVEQQFPSRELVNNDEDGNPWTTVTLVQDCTSIDVAFSFPEGMRQIIVKGKETGNINEATASLEIQYRKTTGPDWASIPTHSVTGTAGVAFSSVLKGPKYAVTEGEYVTNVNLYRWTVFAIGNGTFIYEFDGAATENPALEPSQSLIDSYKAGSYAELVGTDSTYTRLPTIPSGYIPIYRVCMQGSVGEYQIDDLRGPTQGYTGLDITTTAMTDQYVDTSDSYIGDRVKVEIAPGYFVGYINTAPGGTDVQIFTTSTNTMPGTVTRTDTYWGDLLNTYGVWSITGPSGFSDIEFNQTVQVVFPASGYYKVDASTDDTGTIYIDNRKIISIPEGGYRDTISNYTYVEAGTKPLRIAAKNLGKNAGVACRITYNKDGFLNGTPQASTVLTVGTNGFYSKRKDAFNFVYKANNLPKDKYQIRVRRINSDIAEPTDTVHNYHKALLASVIGYDNETPAVNPPGCYIAKTAIRLQSTSKANGSIDGVNAMVQTIAPTWTGTKWELGATNNPASLYIYVLMHPANAYRIEQIDAPNRIDWTRLAYWYDFCNTKKLTFNTVITSTVSVMDVLRDIAAAGKASPSFVDGKWSVVIDEPRTSVVQHFTPHNSWGFEATKILPKIPDAFRIPFANEALAFQPDEAVVTKNFQTTYGNAKIFEELRLPGVTNRAQAEYFAKWHFAQLKLRPETYILNTDFEYLICSRGDLVKVAHDVPLWGTGTGRIKDITNNGGTLQLSEEIYLVAGTAYVIRLRTNTGTNNSKLKYLSAITTSGYYGTINITVPVVTDDNIEADNLYMLGEINKETQDLIVISVEPTGNTSAKLTLVDYSPDIYNEDFTNLVYNPNVTGASLPIGTKSILFAPVITGLTSSDAISEQISSGIYTNILLVSYTNPPNLSISATKVHCQIVLSDSQFSDDTSNNTYIVDKEAGSISIRGLLTGRMYKLRLRYTNAEGSITGPWSPVEITTSDGKGINRDFVNAVEMHLSGTYITANVSQDFVKPANFKTFEYRFKKDSGTLDFWDFDPIANNIIIVQGLSDVSINLIDVPAPRLSDGGITYRVACRALDNNNNYSTTSAFGEVVVTTIT